MSKDFPFELASYVRPTDPPTSQKAARSPGNRLRWGSQRHLLLGEFWAAGASGLTDEEAGKAAGLYDKRSCFWKRCGELRELELIADSGTTRQSECGHDVMVSVITGTGVTVLAHTAP